MRAGVAVAVLLVGSLGAGVGHAREQGAQANQAPTVSIVATGSKAGNYFFPRAVQVASAYLMNKGYRLATAGSAPDIVVKLDYNASSLGGASRRGVMQPEPTTLDTAGMYDYPGASTAPIFLPRPQPNYPTPVTYRLNVAVEVVARNGSHLHDDRVQLFARRSNKAAARTVIEKMLSGVPVAR